MFIDAKGDGPRFKLGDKVREVFPSATAIRETGTIIDRYELAGDYRYVVKFESEREGVFFGHELMPD